jgi:hypothetical protein
LPTHHDGTEVCEQLAKRDIPFLLYMGYGVPLDRWRDVAVIGKPAAPHASWRRVNGYVERET